MKLETRKDYGISGDTFSRMYAWGYRICIAGEQLIAPFFFSICISSQERLKHSSKLIISNQIKQTINYHHQF